MKVKIRHIKICGIQRKHYREGNLENLMIMLRKRKDLRSTIEVPTSKNWKEKSKINLTQAEGRKKVKIRAEINEIEIKNYRET